MDNHKPDSITAFNGLWARGDELSCPKDHFIDCQNLAFFAGGFRTRDGFAPYQNGDVIVENAIRMYNYKTFEAEGLLVLVSGGDIYHVVGQSIVHGPILSIADMEDFGFTSYAGRAYITPYKTYTDDLGVKYQKGLENEFLYVYLGDGTPARKAAGAAPTGVGFAAGTSGAAGFTDPGFHIFAVVYETDTGFLTAPGPEIFATVTTVATEGVTLVNIPVSPSSNVTKRHILATKVITQYNGDQTGYQFFFIQDIEDNTTTTLTFNFYDSELLEDGSYLLYVLAEIPAGVALTTYHNRLILAATFNDISLIMGSVVGEPENISQLTGFMIFPLDARPVTNAQEFRDVLYAFKQTKTGSFIDNGQEPSFWPFAYVDQGVGTSVHGIAKVLDSEGINVNYLIIADYSGTLLFNGAYARPELSYKIQNRWLQINRNDMHLLQFANDSVNQFLYIVMPDGSLMFADYSENLNPKTIKWCPWALEHSVSTVALINTNQLLVGLNGEFIPPVFTTPVISSFTLDLPSVTSEATVSWTIVFSEPVTGVTLAAFQLVNNGLTGTPALLGISGSGTTYQVVASTGGGSGTLGLTLFDPTGITSLNGIDMTDPRVGPVYTVNRSAPVVVSITRDDGTIVAAGGTAHWTVVFSQPVFNVDIADFLAVQIGVTGSIVSSITGINTTYTVAVTVGNGNGSVGLNLVNNNTIINSQTIPLAAGFTGQVYTVQTLPVAPSPVTITFASSSKVTIHWTDNTPNETEFDIERRVGFGSFLPLATVNPNVTSYDDNTVAANTTYTYRVRAVNGVGSSDFAVSPQITTPTAANNPTVLSINRISSTSTNQSTVQYLVTFSEPVAGVTLGAFSLTLSGISGAAVSAMTPSGGNAYVVTVNTGTGDGTLRLNLSTVAGITSAATGLPLTDTFNGQTFTVDKTAPTVTSINRASTNPTLVGETVDWTVVFSEPVTGVALSNFVLSGVSGTLLSLSGSGDTYTVSAQIGLDSGSFELDLIP